MISIECKKISDFLIEKNNSYGNAIVEPVNIFSKLPPKERLNVRLDDKLSRIANGHDYENEDTELDIIGYLIMRRVERKLNNDAAEEDKPNSFDGRLSGTESKKEAWLHDDRRCTCDICTRKRDWLREDRIARATKMVQEVN